jgi:hypothetical protein
MRRLFALALAALSLSGFVAITVLHSTPAVAQSSSGDDQGDDNDSQ